MVVMLSSCCFDYNSECARVCTSDLVSLVSLVNFRTNLCCFACSSPDRVHKTRVYILHLVSLVSLVSFRM